MSKLLRTPPAILRVALFACLPSASLLLANSAEAAPDRCPNSFELSGQRLSYCRTHSVLAASEDVEGITRLVIVLHGNSRNADDYYNVVHDLANEEGVLGHTAIMAPQFGTEEDLEEWGVASNFVYWESSEWKMGGPSEDGEHWSSFRWIDEMLTRVSLNYLQLTDIAIVGFSAGGQFVQRYGAISRLEGPADFTKRVTFGVMAPSSFMFPDTVRPRSTSGCSSTSSDEYYNRYKYGRFAITSTLGSDWSDEVNLITDNLLNRDFYYLIGRDDDYIPLNQADADARSIDFSCAANAQGRSRLERMSNYVSRMISWCTAQGGSGCTSISNDFRILDDIDHSYDEVFDSVTGRYVLFDRQGTIPD